IYDISGRLEKVMVNRYHCPGSYTIHWQQKNNGVYFCKMKVNGVKKIKKFTIIK
ncbi:MAG: hypothetical protein HY769_07280, partial [Candidatus Stahlbacteria bacterium]|nr:hypothetical protein [Candidatus Stahlbacteria bacterium]